MKARKTSQPLDRNTELKIRKAARSIFHEKGFAAARTRDIADEAGINLALLNYYFRSKEKLFQLIMAETLESFFQSLAMEFNDEKTSLDAKVEIIVNRYIDLLLKEPGIPIFLLNELRSNPDAFLKKLNLKQILVSSVLFRQLQQAMKENKLPPMHPLQFMANLMGLVIFPFIASPILKELGDMNQEEFKRMMTERRKLIPGWIRAMMKTA